MEKVATTTITSIKFGHEWNAAASGYADRMKAALVSAFYPFGSLSEGQRLAELLVRYPRAEESARAALLPQIVAELWRDRGCDHVCALHLWDPEEIVLVTPTSSTEISISRGNVEVTFPHGGSTYRADLIMDAWLASGFAPGWAEMRDEDGVVDLRHFYKCRVAKADATDKEAAASAAEYPEREDLSECSSWARENLARVKALAKLV